MNRTFTRTIATFLYILGYLVLFPRSGYGIITPFIENNGQIDQQAAYFAIIDNGSVFVNRTGEIIYSLKQVGVVFRESFPGDWNPAVEGKRPGGMRVNWYRGSDPSEWREDLKTYGTVHLGTPYDSIDVRLEAKEGNVEKIFLVQPGGDAADIRVRVEGIRSMVGNSSGELVLKSPYGQVQFTRPVAYQDDGEQKRMVDIAYRVNGDEYGFKVGDYDRSAPLVIDPLLASSFMGGSRNETAYAVEDSGRDVVVAGMVESPDFPGFEGEVNPLGDAFVALLDRDLTAIRAVSVFGGSMSDGVRDIAMDRGSLYAVGFNISPDFPTTEGAAFDSRTVSGGFVMRLDSATLRLLASTPFYGNIFAVAPAPDGGVFIGGSSSNTTFPTSGRNTPETGDDAFQTVMQGGADGFVVKLDRDLTTVEASTLIGGEGVDIVSDLAVDGFGNPVAVGITNSAGFPVQEGAFDDSYNLEWEGKHQWIDGFIARFTGDLRDLDAATYLGGGSNDYLRSVVLDGDSVIVAGDTASVDFPCGATFGPVDGSDAFVVRLDRYLSKAASCALYGGGASGRGSVDTVSDMAVHPQGSIYLTGRTDTDDFPTTPGAFLGQPEGAYTGGYIAAFSPDLSHMEASTLIHGANEYIKSVAIDGLGNVVVAGDAQDKGYPTGSGSLQSSPAGGDDIILSRFTPDLAGPHLEIIPSVMNFGDIAVGQTGRKTVVLHNIGGSPLTILQGSFSKPSEEFTMDHRCFVIPPFDSCPLEVEFSPRSRGLREAVITFTSDDPFRPDQSVDLSGRGIPAPAAGVQPDPLRPMESVRDGEAGREIPGEPSLPSGEEPGKGNLLWLVVIAFCAVAGFLITVAWRRRFKGLRSKV